ncbi:MAG TPA: recombinase family protein [Micromonosporaceae bacterium]|nr:recombinase family protein [Micromonosporaceae bacterium]
MRAVIYARVSSDPTQQMRSVAGQISECEAFAIRQGWDVVSIFADNDRSASRYATRGRPEYDKLCEFIDGGNADVLLMWEFSRATRDMTTFASLLDLCAARNVAWSYSGRLYDLTRTDDRFATGLDALVAAREASQIRDRVIRGQRQSAAQGRPTGKLPYGYAREYAVNLAARGSRPKLAAQTVREDQAAVVREAARRVADGESCYSVAQDYNARSIPAPRGGQWDLTQIRRVVTSPLYVAQRVYQGRIVGPGDWPPILDETTWARCMARLSDPGRNTTRDREVKHMLSGVARCGVCETALYVQKNRNNYTYQCVSKGFHVGLKVTTFEAFIDAVIVARLGQPDVIEALANRPDDAADVIRARDEVRDLRGRLDAFYAAAARGEISPTGLASIETRLLPEIEVAEARSVSASVPLAVRELSGPDPVALWAAMPVLKRRAIVDFFMKIWLMPVGRGHRIFDPDRVRIEWRAE